MIALPSSTNSFLSSYSRLISESPSKKHNIQAIEPHSHQSKLAASLCKSFSQLDSSLERIDELYSLAAHVSQRITRYCTPQFVCSLSKHHSKHDWNAIELAKRGRLFEEWKKRKRHPMDTTCTTTQT